MLFRRHSRGENSRVGQVLVAWFRDFGRASRPWLRRARRRDGPWGRRRLQDYMTPMLRASETSWHARMPREYARRIVRGRDRSAKKISTPTPLDRRRRSMVKLVKLVGGCGKGERGMNHPDPFVLRSGRWNARETR